MNRFKKTSFVLVVAGMLSAAPALARYLSFNTLSIGFTGSGFSAEMSTPSLLVARLTKADQNLDNEVSPDEWAKALQKFGGIIQDKLVIVADTIACDVGEVTHQIVGQDVTSRFDFACRSGLAKRVELVSNLFFDYDALHRTVVKLQDEKNRILKQLVLHAEFRRTPIAEALQFQSANRLYYLIFGAVLALGLAIIVGRKVFKRDNK